MNCDILLTNALLLAEPESGTLQENSYVAMGDGVILATGPMASLPGGSIAGQTIDVAGNLVMPGLTNTHAHGAMTLFRGLADDLPLMTWLQEHIFPAEARFVSPEMVYWCSRLAAAEMIMAGTTTVADAYFHEDAAARAFSDSGLRAVAAQGVIDFPAPGVPDPAGNIAAAHDFICALQARGSLVEPAVFCHSPYTCSPETMEKAKALARDMGVLFFMHVAETRGEVAQCREQYGKTPVALLHDLGLLDENSVCVHGVWLSDEDIDLLAQSGASVVTCPESNMKLASGVAPVAKLLKATIPVGLGTDGTASNNDLDLFAEMGLCAKLHKVSALQPTLLPGTSLLGMATSGGARVLAKGGELGALLPGKRADCIVVDLQQPHLVPFYNASTLVYAGRGSDVLTSIIDGRLVMENRRLLTCDLAEVMAKVAEMAARVKAAV